MNRFKAALVPVVIGALFALVAQNGLATEPTTRGTLSGGVAHTAPDWFKQGFLEIQDDAEEAGDANKHVMLFFQLNNCPYCDRMLSESFETDPVSQYIQQHFDVIAINVKGDREVVFNQDLTVLEKELADILRVRATPAILFLNSDNRSVLRADGYRAPQRFQAILEYVSSKSYLHSSLADFMEKRLEQNVYQLRDHEIFQSITDLSEVEGPLAVIFEDSSCYDCAEFHDNLLANPLVLDELKAFTVVRLDAKSTTGIIDIDGNATTATDLARQYEMTYRPGVLIFDEGLLQRRYDSLLYSYHFKEGLRYISGGYYKVEDSRSYSQRRRQELLASGVDIDLAK